MDDSSKATRSIKINVYFRHQDEATRDDSLIATTRRIAVSGYANILRGRLPAKCF